MNKLKHRIQPPSPIKHEMNYRKPFKRGSTNIHEAPVNFNFLAKACTLALLPSKHLKFLSFQIIHIRSRKEKFHISFPLGEFIGAFHSSKWTWMLWRNTHVHPNQPKIDLQRKRVTWQLRIRWSMVSSSFRHKGQAFTTMTPLRRRLSIARILLRIASHPKACTLGALSFQILDTLLLKEGILDIPFKKKKKKTYLI